MEHLLPLAEKIGALLKSRGETIATAESSAGGLISASLLAVPGASAYFLGGATVYTKVARQTLLGISPAAMVGLRGATKPYALLLARTVRERFSTSWGLAETGAAGPTGNSYGDPPGHSCIALVGPDERSAIIGTGGSDRAANMRAFASAALEMLLNRISL